MESESGTDMEINSIRNRIFLKKEDPSHSPS